MMKNLYEDWFMILALKTKTDLYELQLNINEFLILLKNKNETKNQTNY